ncbi:MAG: cupin domain-containing protein [Thiomicrospira sp.]|uniref:cupin domain-containing protein n=1 Tax=Thiomicrospira sp. TaxID=935 RepID=UPI001A096549|nr:cupin domain-containing protein [Thiomicrospira sp.]MBE0492957.1 cupin domain-containing protein [Thiomicrospira sp.]
MSPIVIQSQPSQIELDKLGVQHWPTWQKQPSEFDWHYDATEVCYLIKGEVLVTPEQGKAVLIKAGDLVTFPADLNCQWQVKQAVLKHYQFY